MQNDKWTTSGPFVGFPAVELVNIFRDTVGLEDALRAVQSAVLAKAEVEAREMQREAFGVGWYHGKFGEAVDPVRDAKYPSLRPPKTVTLSDGRKWWRVANPDFPWSYTHPRAEPAIVYSTPVIECFTADDHEKVAAYLRAEGK